LVLSYMDRKSLHELENKCIQEEPPACVTSCPIHVDARTFLAKAADEKWDEAVDILSTVMPFPGILARICDHPCEAKCLRAKAGDPIAIGDVEKVAIRKGSPRKKPHILPPRSQTVAIVGAGLSGLTAASDLLRKGYDVTIITGDDRLAGVLRDWPAALLPSDVVDEEIAALERIGLKKRLSVRFDSAFLEIILKEFDAVYVAARDAGPLPFDLPPSADSATLATTVVSLFVGEKQSSTKLCSVIGAVAEGRKAATSIDRQQQKVSLTAGRDREGTYETKLFTSLEGILSSTREPMGVAEAGYSEAEAAREARRCIRCECMECVKKCLFLERFKGFPKKYVRQIGNEATMVMGAHGETIKLVNSCSLCGLCELVCPNGLSMASICMEGREGLVARGRMAPSAHDFALMDMASGNSPAASLALHEPGKTESRYAFFPGCQLSAVAPDHVLTAYDTLRSRMEGGMGLILRCCGAPAEWAARKDLMDQATKGLTQDWENLGRPTLITACPTCTQMLKKHVPQSAVTTLWQVLSETDNGEKERTPAKRPTLTIHDPCTTRHEPEIQDSVRTLLTRRGYAIEELPLSREKTECCGFGGLMSAANPRLAKDVALKRASESAADYVTYCAMCRNAFAASGKRVTHLLDLLLGTSVPDPAARKAVGYSERRENRYRLKRKLLSVMWGAKEGDVEAHETIKLLLPESVALLLEERRILREDVQKVILHSQETGSMFRNKQTGRFLASFRPGTVTYWVEYSPEGDAYRIHNAYYHRMEIVTDGGSSATDAPAAGEETR
jgi:glutamate synthase (NADPH) small chain